ncbi:Protein KRI1 [Nymphon striatum]|nr:Protein KRI1 [Nymphon striatum]
MAKIVSHNFCESSFRPLKNNNGSFSISVSAKANFFGLDPPPTGSMTPIKISTRKVRKALLLLNATKSKGPDDIPAIVLKTPELALVLTNYCNSPTPLRSSSDKKEKVCDAPLLDKGNFSVTNRHTVAKNLHAIRSRGCTTPSNVTTLFTERWSSMDFDSNKDDGEFTINTSYADNYNRWRQKEELQKFKDRYQTDDISLLEKSSSDSESSEDEDAEVGSELTPDVEKQFIKTLGLLKKKDPRIYDKNTVFFEEKEENTVKTKKKKEKPLFLRDYERKIITEKNGELSEEEEIEKDDCKPLSNARQREEIKKSFLQAAEDVGDDEDSFFNEKQKTEVEKEKEEKDYMKWLKDQEVVDDVTGEMEYLKSYWKDPKLDSDECFLRDYLIDKKYLDHSNDEDEDDDDEEKEYASEDEEKITEFEHKYNFRFEEPDKEFIKRYPRTMTNSLRTKDDRRSKKREIHKEQNQKKKDKIKEDIKLLKILKRSEILEKLEKLKEMTGNDDVGFKDSDVDGDFDPAAHDRRMQELFDVDYYEAQEENDQKPMYSDFEDEETGELATENWDDWTGQENNLAPDCEHPDFNMDAAFIPNQQKETNKKKMKNMKKQNSRFAEILSSDKPVFDPKNKKTYEEYLDEYYKLDYEDIIGDMPTRFKYREVVANDFGLSVDEILVAKDKDLNKWCSVKKMSQYRTQEEEQYDTNAFKIKAQQEHKKRQLIPSLYEPSTSRNSRLLAVAQCRHVDMKKVLSYELSTVPPSLIHKDRSMKKTGKAELTKKLEANFADILVELPQISTIPEPTSSAYIIDGYYSETILHAISLSRDHSRVIVRCDDTDVLVLLIYYSSREQLAEEVYMYTGHSGKERYIPVHEIVTQLKSIVCECLPAVHAIGGCDTICSFNRIGKRTAYSTLIKNAHTLSDMKRFHEADMDTCISLARKFVLLMYGKKGKHMDSLNDLRFYFATTTDTPASMLLPTEDSFGFIQTAHPSKQFSKEQVEESEYKNDEETKETIETENTSNDKLSKKRKAEESCEVGDNLKISDSKRRKKKKKQTNVSNNSNADNSINSNIKSKEETVKNVVPKKKKKKQTNVKNSNADNSINNNIKPKDETVQNVVSKKKKKNMNNPKVAKGDQQILDMSDKRLKAYGLNPKKFKNKIKYKKTS